MTTEASVSKLKKKQNTYQEAAVKDQLRKYLGPGQMEDALIKGRKLGITIYKILNKTFFILIKQNKTHKRNKNK